MIPIPLIQTAGGLLEKVIDLFEGDDKREAETFIAQSKQVHERMMGQQEINKVEASHRSVFVAGWRPSVGWVCAAALFSNYVVRPYVMAFFPSVEIPSIDDALFELLLGLCGIAGLRTFEKHKGLTK